MSTDYDIKCTKCGVKIETVASGSIAYGDKLWREDKKLTELSDFLFSHRGHQLIFDDSQMFDDEYDNEV